AIGGEYMYWPGDPLTPSVRKFGPRENAYAVSEDGRSLLYFREPPTSTLRLLFQQHPNEYTAELHLYRHGLGDSLIVAGVDHFRGGPAVPEDAVVYAVPGQNGVVSDPIVRSIRDFLPRSRTAPA